MRGPIEMALGGGDDYELLFTAPAARAGRFADPPAEWAAAVQRVGRVEAGEGAFFENDRGLRRIDDLGFDHFGAAP